MKRFKSINSDTTPDQDLRATRPEADRKARFEQALSAVAARTNDDQAHEMAIMPETPQDTQPNPEHLARPSREDAEKAVRTLLAWAGDDPSREGLIDTPRRVTKAFLDYFCGYGQNAEEILERTFEETDGYDEMVLVRDIDLFSHCEHHMAPFIGKVHIAYLPDRRVVGLSKLVRVAEVYARRLQTQEKLTAQIANAINRALKPRGVAVYIESTHQCMTMRGVQKPEAKTITTKMLGLFETNPAQKREFLDLVGK